VDDIVTVSEKQDGLISIISGKRSWDLRTLHNLTTDKPKEPTLDYTVSCTLEPVALKDKISDVAVFAKTAHFVAKENEIHLTSSDDAGKAKSQIETSTDSVILQEADTEYSLEYIGDVMSAVSALSTSVKVSFSHRKPMLMEFEIPNAGILRFHLGPLLVN